VIAQPYVCKSPKKGEVREINDKCNLNITINLTPGVNPLYPQGEGVG
jgi:hypothetical protein